MPRDGVRSTRPALRSMQLRIKRAFDIGVAIVAVLLTCPLVAIAAALVYLEDRGPVLYAQRRVGYRMQEFTVIKLRSLRANTLAVADVGEVGTGHPLVTRVGSVIRRAKIDELPQLINVLRGEMSVIGPRPTVPEQVAAYTAFERRRLEMRPGLTGWAQVNGGTRLDWSDRILLDVWYLDNWSLALDARILAQTLRVLLLGDRPNDRALEQATQHAASSPVRRASR